MRQQPQEPPHYHLIEGSNPARPIRHARARHGFFVQLRHGFSAAIYEQTGTQQHNKPLEFQFDNCIIDSLNDVTGESGGIGRRAGFRCQWGNP